jgi:SAM-dependent methyltransferase
MRLRRQRTDELMDRPEADPEQLSRSLLDLRQVNRWLGGRGTAIRLVADLASRIPSSPVRILDVGTGAADIPLAISEAARKQGWEARITATDVHPSTLAFARRAAAGDPNIQVLPGDLLALPFGDAAFDIAICSTTLHHFEREEALVALRELGRVARWGVVVTDLARSRLALLGAHALAHTVWRRHPITRHDGPASVRAAFTPDELRRMAASTWGEAVRVRSHPGFRLSLVLDRTGRRGR